MEEMRNSSCDLLSPPPPKKRTFYAKLAVDPDAARISDRKADSAFITALKSVGSDL